MVKFILGSQNSLNINIFNKVSWQNGHCGVLLIPFFRGSIPLDALI